MDQTCQKCGLPKELCTCEALIKEKEAIRVFNMQKRYGKLTTVIEGMTKDVDLRKILKDLKHKLACGGTLRDTTIELQGNHKNKIKNILVKLGFPEEQIEVS